MASRNLTHRPTRSIVTMMSIAIGAAALALTLQINGSLNTSLRFKAPSLVVLSATGVNLPIAARNTILQIPGVTVVEYQHFFSGQYPPPSPENYAVWIASDHFADLYPDALLDIDPAVTARWMADKRGMIAAARLAKSYGWKVGDHVTLQTDEVPSIECVYVGPSRGDFEGAILHYDYGKDVMARPNTVGRFAVGCEPARCDEVARAIDAAFTIYPQGSTTVTQREFFRYATNYAGLVPTLFVLVSTGLIIIILFMAVSSLTASLRERRGEIATLRALGFTRARVVILVVFESSLSAFIGGLLGAGLMTIFTQLHPVTLEQEVLNNISISPRAALVAIAASLLLGIVVALIPIALATRQNIVNALND